MATTRVNAAELFVGAYRSGDVAAALSKVLELLATFWLLELDAHAADEFGHLKAVVGRAGTPIGDADLLIAAIALTNGCSLLTRNVRDFSKVPGLWVQTY